MFISEHTQVGPWSSGVTVCIMKIEHNYNYCVNNIGHLNICHVHVDDEYMGYICGVAPQIPDCASLKNSPFHPYFFAIEIEYLKEYPCPLLINGWI